MEGPPNGGASGKSHLLTHQLFLTVSQSMWQFAWLRPKVLTAAGETHGQIQSGISWEGARGREGGHGHMTTMGHQVQRGLGNGWSTPSVVILQMRELSLREGT